MVQFLARVRLSRGPRGWPATAVVLPIISFLIMYPFLGGYNALNKADFQLKNLSFENLDLQPPGPGLSPPPKKDGPLLC